MGCIMQHTLESECTVSLVKSDMTGAAGYLRNISESWEYKLLYMTSRHKLTGLPALSAAGLLL